MTKSVYRSDGRPGRPGRPEIARGRHGARQLCPRRERPRRPDLPEPGFPVEGLTTVELMEQALAGATERVTLAATGPITNVASLIQRGAADQSTIRVVIFIGGSVDCGNHARQRSSTPTTWRPSQPSSRRPRSLSSSEWQRDAETRLSSSEGLRMFILRGGLGHGLTNCTHPIVQALHRSMCAKEAGCRLGRREHGKRRRSGPISPKGRWAAASGIACVVQPWP